MNHCIQFLNIQILPFNTPREMTPSLSYLLIIRKHEDIGFLDREGEGEGERFERQAESLDWMGKRARYSTGRKE